MKKLTLSEFSNAKREKLLDYEIYSENFEDASATINEIRAQLEQPPSVLEAIPLSAFLQATSGLARASIKHLTNLYSGGHAISELRVLYPTVLECWETFAKYAEAYGVSDEGRDTYVAHIPLQGAGYYNANRLVCFAILLGWTQHIGRLMAIIDFNNPAKDGLLERLVIPYMPMREVAPEECTRHLPYFKTLKIFKALPELRSHMMGLYMEDWYHASRREPYYDSHEKDTSFVGYWAFEAAAITFILNIDDTEYRHVNFYPADLVEFARTNYNGKTIDAANREAEVDVRVKSGDICPLTGRWETLNTPVQSKIFQTGDIITDVLSAYGITIWIYKGEA